ncbi:MAG: HzsA-related protein [Planctomycetota bacterium]
MVLDDKGRALQRMRSFTHLMPGETQGCVGCHEPRRQSPPAQRGVRSAMLPTDLEEPEWGITGFDYSRIVQPVLDEHCAGCHNAIDPPKGIDLTGGKTDYFNVSYDVLARDNQGRKGSPYISWIPTYNGHEQNILEVSPMAWGSPQSKLAEVVLSGHPDENGQPRIQLDDKSRRRILAWIDLNVPYYGSSETAYPENVGCRRIYPENLDRVLSDVGKRRCGQCHDKGEIPRRVWTRVTEPELNNFLLAPLAKAAGGSEKCRTAVFADAADPDYQAILATFETTTAMLKQTPRMDMPGGRPAPDVCRDCQ